MSFPALLVIGLVVLTVLSSFLKTLAGVAGLPNLMPLIRDPLLIGLAIYGLGKIDLFASRKWLLLMATLCGFAAPYLFISMMEDRAIIGLYYLRFYLLPFFFFVGALGILTSLPAEPARNALVRFLVYWNAALFIVAVTIYALLQITPSLRPTFFGLGILPTAWYLSGGTWMRMGLPAAGPNTLGLIFALHAMTFLAILMTRKTLLNPLAISNHALVSGALIALLGLMLSFSRSSMLLVIFGVPALLLLPGMMTFPRFLKTLLTGVAMLVTATVIAVVVDIGSDGYVTRWLTLNASFKDPSMLGHLRSIEFAIDKFHEYILWGYPRGTVGPKATLFAGTISNVENSFLGVLYDMGLLIGALYTIAAATLYAIGYRNRIQLVFLFGFALPCLLLPYVFEADVLIYFSFIYLAMGLLTDKHVAPVRPRSIYIGRFA